MTIHFLTAHKAILMAHKSILSHNIYEPDCEGVLINAIWITVT